MFPLNGCTLYGQREMYINVNYTLNEQNIHKCLFLNTRRKGEKNVSLFSKKIFLKTEKEDN